MTSPHRPEGPDEGMEQAEEDLQFLDAQLSVSDEEYRKSLIELLFLEKGGDYLQINNFHARPSKTAIELVEENCPITSEQEEKDVIKSINQKTNKIGDHDSEETEIAPMEDQALDQDVAEKLSSSTRFTRAQLKEHDRLNSTEQNQQEEMYVVPRTESEQTTPVPKRPETSQKPKNGSPRTLSTVEKVLMANHFSDSQRSAYVERTVSQLKSQGLWSAQRLPKLVNKNKTKTNWDYVLGEMQWLATDFAQERKWKMAAARKISRAVRNYHRAKAERAKKEEREVYLKKRRTAAKIARMVHHFWDGINNVVQYKHKSLMEEKRQKILDIQLNYIVGQTERYSGYLTKQLQGESAEIKPIDAADTATIEEVSAENQPTATAEGEQVPNEDQSKEEEPMEGDDDASKASEKEPSAGKDEKAGKSLPVRRSSRKRPASEDSVGDKPAKIAKEDEKGAAVSAEKVDLTDAEFKADNEESEDDEETLLEEEQKETEGNHEEEIKELEEENDLSIEELMKRYGYEVPTDDDVTTANSKPESEEQEMEADNESKTEKKEEEEEGSDHDEEVGLKFLVDGETPADDTTDGKQAADEKDGDFDSAAKQARDIQPTGHTLATTQVKTPIPKLLRGELREYQHIGLNWLVTLYNERLNGILADEMGLGKTIQTIALLAHLACEKGVWGPHLIVVPTSVMLNWEMEFKKWAPGFKILTYYGSQKERKMKRTGWSKSNAFHVCITSYKLVVQDHAAFRRKKWRYFILDEAHNIKNFKSQRWQALLNFNSQRRLLLTGTPLQNNLMELWSLMHFLMPHLFQSRNDFKEWFANPMDGMVGGEAEYNDGIIQRLHKVLRPFLLRRLKKEVEKQMPNKYEHVVRCHLSKRQRYLYEDFMSRAATRDTLSKGDLMSVMNVLMQLRKVCNHPNLFEPRPIVTSFNTKALVYETPSIVASATIKDSFQEICLDNVNLNLQRFCGFSTFDVDSIHTLRPARKMIEELISAPPTRPLPKKTSIPGDMRKRIMESLKKKTISAYQNRLEEVKKNAAAALSTKESSSVPYSTHHSSSSTAHKLISFANSTALRNNISQGRSLHAPTSSANPQRRMAANGQIVQLTAAGRIQIYSNARGLSGSGALDRMKGGNKRLDAESYSKWLTRIQQTRKAETLARIARVNEKRCDMSNQCLSANVISMLQGITLNKKKPVYDNRYYQEIISIFTNVLYKKVMEEETLSKIDLLVPSVEAPCMQLNVQHLVPWKEYGLKTKKDFIRNYFRNNYPSWKMNARKLLFPETQLIEYDCGKLQVLNILLRQFISGKHRVLIFTQMTKVLDILEVFLNYHGYRYLRLDGSTHIEERMIRMERFNNDKRIFCFILSTRSGGIGVNLTGADTVVFYDSDWNPTMDAQAQDRCHRIGQTRDVHIYRLISERTVEENILRKANQKRMLNNLAIEGGHFTTHFFTKHGLKDIFDEPCSLENIDEEQKAQAKKAEAVATAAAAKKSETSSEQSSTTTATAESTAVTCGGNTDEMAFGEALLKSEDKEDQNAAEMVEKEQMAEMEEFGEQQNAAATEESKVVTRAEEKIRAVYEQLTPLQRFAVEFIERNSELSFDDQIHQAKEDLERAKKTWEVNHLLSLKEEEERRLEEEEDDIFYVCADGINQHFYDVHTGEEMPTWYPPTPPMDDDDFYIDYSSMYLYDYIPMLDEELPPYVPIIPEPKPPVRRTLKSDPNFNNCLFKHSGHKRKDKSNKVRSQSSKNKTPSSSLLLGAMRHEPSSVASPKDGSDPSSLAKSDSDKNWSINEDCSVLHGLNDMVEHNPIMTLPAQLLDWSLIANVVRPAGTRYRSGEDCRRRYDTTIVPREEAMKSVPNLLPGIEVNKMVADTYTPPKKKQKTSTKAFHNKNKPPLSTGNIGAELTPTSASESTTKSFVEDKNRQFTRNLFGWFNSCIEIEPPDKRNKSDEHNNNFTRTPGSFSCNPNQLKMLNDLNIAYEKPQNSLALNPVAGGRSKRIANQKRNISAVNSEGGIVSASIAPGGQQQQQHPVVNITTNMPQAVALTQQLSGFVVANGRNNVVVNSPSLARRITGQQTQYKNSSNANQSVQNQATAKIHQNKSVPLTFRAMPGNSISQLQLQQQQPGGSSTNPPSMTVFASVASGQQSSSLVTLSTAPTVTSSSRQQVSYQARNAGQLQKITGSVQHVRQQKQQQQQHQVIQQVNQLKQQQVKVKQVRVSQAVHQLQGSVVQSGGKTTVVGGKAVQIAKQAQPSRYDLYMKRAPSFKSFQQRPQKPIQNQKTNIKLKGETVARRSSKGGGEKGQVQAQQVRNLVAHQANQQQQQQQQANTSKSTAYSMPVTAVTLNVSSASQQKMIVANNSQQLQLNSQPQMIIQQPTYFRPKQNNNSQQQQARQVIASKQGKAMFTAMSGGGQQQLITGNREVKMGPGISTQMVQAHVQLSQPRPRRATSSSANSKISNVSQTLTVTKLVQQNAATSGLQPRHSLVSQVRQVHPVLGNQSSAQMIVSSQPITMRTTGVNQGTKTYQLQQTQQPLQVNIRTPTNLNILSSSAAPQYQNISASQQLINVTSQLANTIVTSSSQISSQSNSGAGGGDQQQDNQATSASDNIQYSMHSTTR